MQNFAFMDALTQAELDVVAKNPQEAVAHGLIALLRSEGDCMAGPSTLVGKRGDTSAVIVLDSQPELGRRMEQTPGRTDLKNGQARVGLVGKYDWLEASLSGPTGELVLKLKDPGRMMKHLAGLKRSVLLEAKLKRTALEMANLQAHHGCMHVLGLNPPEEVREAVVKLHCWGSAITTLLSGHGLDEVCTEQRGTKVKYRTGDVLKAMDGDVALVRSKVFETLQRVEAKDVPPGLREMLPFMKADAAKAAAGQASQFKLYFAMAEDIGRTAQELVRTREREQRMAKE